MWYRLSGSPAGFLLLVEVQRPLAEANGLPPLAKSTTAQESTFTLLTVISTTGSGIIIGGTTLALFYQLQIQ